jgi:hypothetical protein
MNPLIEFYFSKMLPADNRPWLILEDLFTIFQYLSEGYPSNSLILIIDSLYYQCRDNNSFFLWYGYIY